MPSLDVLWSYRYRPAPALNIVKATRAAMVFRNADGLDFVRIALRYFRWPLRFPLLLIHALRVGSRNAQRQCHRSILWQISDIIRVAVINNLEPEDYYLAALARYAGGPEMLRYLPFEVVSAVARELSRETGSASIDIRDKAAFETLCRTRGLRVVRTIAIANEGAMLTTGGDAFEGPLPNHDLIIKPVTGLQGRGIEMWRNEGPDRFLDAGNEVLSSAALAARAASLASARGCAMLLQERVKNHPCLQPLAGAALATTRIVTMFNESGEPEVVDSFYRTSIAPHAAVDNFHNGGVIFPVDITSGTLRPGMTDCSYDQPPITHHPETGVIVAGQVHPGWNAMVRLALRLHHLFPELTIPGWDIGFDKDGPIAVEGNDVCGFSLNRQATFGGLVGTRALALLAYHAEGWLARNEPASSRWRSQMRLQAGHLPK